MQFVSNPKTLIVIRGLVGSIFGRKKAQGAQRTNLKQSKVTLLLCVMKHQAAVVPRFLKLGIILNRVISYIPLLLYPQQKSPQYSLDRRLDASNSRYGRSGEENNHLHLKEIASCAMGTGSFPGVEAAEAWG